MAEVYTMTDVIKNVLKRGISICYVSTRSKGGLK